MTYEQLYSEASTWTARHVAQDLLMMYGRKTEATEHDIQTVNYWQVKEGGEKIPALCAECGQSHGKHSFVGDNCPEGDWYSSTKTFAAA